MVLSFSEIPQILRATASTPLAQVGSGVAQYKGLEIGSILSKASCSLALALDETRAAESVSELRQEAFLLPGTVRLQEGF
eukprot:7126642-Alexandrium_andersonii.AAC.1